MRVHLGEMSMYNCCYKIERRDFTDKGKSRSGHVKVLLVAGVLLGDGHLAHPELYHGVIKLDHLCADVPCGAEMETLYHLIRLIENISSAILLCILQCQCLMRK